MSLRRADVIMTSSKMPFYCIRGEKTNSVSVNNFNKSKHMFIFLYATLEKQPATDNVLIVHFARILTPLYRVN